jgi:hypothetical protein
MFKLKIILILLLSAILQGYSQTLKIDSVNVKRVNRGIAGAIECEMLLQTAKHDNDSLIALHNYRDTTENLLYMEINKQDTIINRMQKDQNELIDLIAKQNSFIRQIEKLKWHERLFKQKEIIKVYLNNTP